jgi:hypothetical protein
LKELCSGALFLCSSVGTVLNVDEFFEDGAGVSVWIYSISIESLVVTDGLSDKTGGAAGRKDVSTSIEVGVGSCAIGHSGDHYVSDAMATICTVDLDLARLFRLDVKLLTKFSAVFSSTTGACT